MKTLKKNSAILIFLVVCILWNSCKKPITLNENRLIPLGEIGILQTKKSSEIDSSPFGIQAGTLEDSLVVRAAEIGVKWTRLGASWNSIEKEKGVYNWEETDKAFEVALKNGITPFVTIGHGNELYSKLTTYDDPKLAEIYGYRPEPPIKDPVAMKAFLDFTRATVDRYKDQIDYWEVWNEPNHRNYWGSDPDGKEYGQLLVQTANVIKEVDPGSKVIGGSMAGIDPEFTEAFLSVDSDKLIDIISYHNYGAVPEERVYPAIELWKVIDKYNPDIELWQGECGYPSHSSTRDFRGRAPWGLNIQAKWLLRQSFVDVFYCKATLSNYFKLVHTSGKGESKVRTNLRPIDEIFGYPERGGSRVRTWGVNEKCLLTNPAFEPKPAFYGYQNLCAVWKPGYKPNPIEYNTEIVDEGIFYGISEDDAFPSVPLVAAFSDGEGNNLVAWWLPWNAQENLSELATINISLNSIQFEDPVMLDPLTGKVYEIEIYNNENGCSLENAVLADYPFIVAERTTVEIQ
jgi:polysaccharide biosynthesis protein PslG